jgi:AraC-like DNA-binding protein
LGGTGALTGRQRLPLAVHDICLIPPRARHDEVSDEDFDTIWIGFLGTRVPRLTQPVVIRSEPLTRQIEQLWLLAQRRGEPIGPELDAATAAVLARFLRQLQEGGAAGDTDLMGRAVRYLGQHLTEEIFVPAVARKFGCSEGHFHRLFKQQTGQTPMAYLTRLRGQHAAHLLTQTDLPVAEIARQVGYTDPLYFSRVLRQMTGLSPTQYRAQHRRSIHH